MTEAGEQVILSDKLAANLSTEKKAAFDRRAEELIREGGQTIEGVVNGQSSYMDFVRRSVADPLREGSEISAERIVLETDRQVDGQKNNGDLAREEWGDSRDKLRLMIRDLVRKDDLRKEEIQDLADRILKIVGYERGAVGQYLDSVLDSVGKVNSEIIGAIDSFGRVKAQDQAIRRMVVAIYNDFDGIKAMGRRKVEESNKSFGQIVQGFRDLVEGIMEERMTA